MEILDTNTMSHILKFKDDLSRISIIAEGSSSQAKRWKRVAGNTSLAYRTSRDCLQFYLKQGILKTFGKETLPVKWPVGNTLIKGS